MVRTGKRSAGSHQRLVRPIVDNFFGNNKHLKACIRALIEMNDDGCLVPHGIGGHARGLLSSCYHRLA